MGSIRTVETIFSFFFFSINEENLKAYVKTLKNIID